MFEEMPRGLTRAEKIEWWWRKQDYDWSHSQSNYDRRPNDPPSSFARRPKHLDRGGKGCPDRHMWKTAHDVAERIHLDAVLLHRRHDFGNVWAEVEAVRWDLNSFDTLRVALMATGILLKKAHPPSMQWEAS